VVHQFPSGLGHLLHYGRELSAMDQVIGVMIVIVLIGLLADKVLFSPWEQFLHRRWGTEQLAHRAAARTINFARARRLLQSEGIWFRTTLGHPALLVLMSV
jgi:hypothetical protein